MAFAGTRNLIVIVLDSLRQDHVSSYHGGRQAFTDVAAVNTPTIDAFAQRSAVFRSAYPEALPTIPIRCQLMTGQRTLPSRPWEPLTHADVPLAEILSKEGFTCGLISDVYHYRAPGMNYHRGFHSYDWIRGQEYDPWVVAKPRRSVDDFVNAHYPPEWRARVAQYLANTDHMQDAAARFPVQVFGKAVHWLESNRDVDRLFLWVDSFDPHEPWDPPVSFDRFTDPAYRGPKLLLPMGGSAASWASPEEIRYIRGLYAGEVAFVDHALGELAETLERLGYMEDSLIVLLGDHGHPLADHGKFLKGPDRLHSELLNVPFMIHVPGQGKGFRTEAMVQFQDLAPTVLEMLGLGNDIDAMHGKSFKKVLLRETDSHRHAVITGYYEGIDRCIRDKRWSYVERPERQPDELYDLEADPRERQNVIDEHRDEAERLSSLFGAVFRRRSPGVKGIQGKYEMASGTVD